MPTSARYARPSLEFERIATFSDGVFAIAMTLLVVGIGVPKPTAGQSLADALRATQPEILSFFVSFVVIGFFWRGHHRFFASLGAVDTGFMTLSLPYLAAVAFIPFPTSLVGDFDTEAVSVVLYAITLAAVSALEVVQYWWARRHALFRRPLSDRAFEHGLVASSVPVLVFAVSIPLAIAWSPRAALYSWLAIYPLEVLVDRLLPADEEGSS